MNERIAIVGMEAIIATDGGLAELDRTLFDGLSHSDPPPADQRRLAPATIGRGSLARPSMPGPAVPDADALLRRAIAGARADRGPESADRAWRDTALILWSDRAPSLPDVEAARILTERSLARALHAAHGLLRDRVCLGAVVAAVHLPDAADASAPQRVLAPGEGAGAVFLKRLGRAEEDRDRIYAVIDAVVLEPDADAAAPPHPSLEQRTADVCRRAFALAGVRPGEIGCLEVSGKCVEDLEAEEIRGLVDAYATGSPDLSCALGSAHSNLASPSRLSGLASLIKTALALCHRYIAAVPHWAGPPHVGPWEKSAFYVAAESRPWFRDRQSPRRVAAIHSAESGAIAHWVLSEFEPPQPRPSPYLTLCAPYCIPLAGDRQADLTAQLERLHEALPPSSDLASLAAAALDTFQARPTARHALMVVGYTKDELTRELQFLRRRLPAAFESGVDLRTPSGSYFTPRPLGAAGAVAFVYPGIGSAYVGLGHALFHLFPELFDRLARQTADMGGWLKARELYPRTLRPLTQAEILQHEQRLREDIVGMCYCATGFCILYTAIMADVFKVQPQYAVGYSWGEPGMMAAFRLWADLDPLKERLATFPTFTHRLHRAMTCVREQWGLPPSTSAGTGRIWESYTLQATPAAIQAAIGRRARVFLTIINSPDEAVIAGDPDECQAVIKALGCTYYPLALDVAIHCEAARPEHDAIAQIFTLPVHQKPPVKLFSSSCYKSLPITSRTLAFSIARAFCEPVDFPRLIDQVYESGARIFIELGPRKFCSNMIDRILDGRDHVALSINVKGARDHTSLARALAQLASHRVSVDLTPLYHR